MPVPNLARSPWPWIAASGFIVPAGLGALAHVYLQGAALEEPYSTLSIVGLGIYVCVWLFAMNRTMSMMSARQTTYEATIKVLPPAPGSRLKTWLVWRIPQIGFFLLGAYAVQKGAERDGVSSNLAGMIACGLLISAAYTGGAHLIGSVLARLIGRFRVRPDDGQALHQGIGFSGTGRRGSELAKHTDRRRIGN